MPTEPVSKRVKSAHKQAPTQSLSVALLMDDMEVARDFSRLFRKVGVMPFVYQDLQHFWDDIYGQRPSLSVIDVKMMSQGSLLLRDHPLVKASQLELSFYYGPGSEPLIYSTFDMEHLGLISSELNLKGQVKTVLRRFNDKANLEKQVRTLKTEEERLEGRVTGLLRQLETLKEKDFYAELGDSIIERFEAAQTLQSFEDTLDRIMGSLQEVRSFSLYELSKNGQKLLSPQLTSQKYRALPPVWLGTSSTEGIQNFAQGMAQQVAAEVIGAELMALSICGESRNPDKLLLIEVSDENLLNLLPWNRIENYLSGLYARYLISERELEFDVETEVSPWQMMGLLDRIYLDGKSVVVAPKADKDQVSDNDDYALIGIDFTKLLNFIRVRKTKVRFYWSDFYREFFKRFEVQYKSHFRLASLGVQKTLLLVERKDADRIFTQLRAFIGRYPLWRYFEDVDVVLASDLRPEVKMIPASSLGVLNDLENGLGKAQTLDLTDQTSSESIAPARDKMLEEQLAQQMQRAQQSQLNAMERQMKREAKKLRDFDTEDDIVSTLEFVTGQSEYREKISKSPRAMGRTGRDLSLDL